MKGFLKILLHLLVVIVLTIVTQVGGIIYLIAILSIKRRSTKRRLKKVALFCGLYFLTTFLLVPVLAPLFGREKIAESKTVKAHSFFYKLANRNYVEPELNKIIFQVANELNQKHPELQFVYLDANFPFIDGFPLLPHLSHNDGKKIDISLVYETKEKILSNKKKSISGYGTYAAPEQNEYDQIAVCKNKGNWQYDFPKYLTFGTINDDLILSKNGTRYLANSILKQKQVGKLFIEPHLKQRLKLNNSKVRFHGCQAVRHDDHIHFQLK
ncbi:hypothetical protein GWK10_16025 [Spongiivirga citrea]|uniref:Uncharacterized protein n=1 Tax=Spongiivirga citrea TaxID=1481457 RepID=A0A6M0CT87_9FLAO|nr:hypothetical protein [Spongiivirga citrea]